MTYCLGIVTRFGLVLASDSRTNAGVDYISTYRKLFDFSVPHQRTVILCSSGNLSVTQGVLRSLRHDIQLESVPNLHTLPTLYDIARYIGDKIRQVLECDRPWLEKDGIDHTCSILLGGQVQGESPELYLIYSQGNFIQATPETCFLQIGETKYGKPILDRTLTYETPLEKAAKCALLSIDSTMKSNISVGPPINMVMYEADTFQIKHQLSLPLGDPYLSRIRKLWEASVRKAFTDMPDIEWAYRVEDSAHGENTGTDDYS
ncbi:MAG: proteasome-type protease [Synechococcales bacterium]|nr:proteasome-type protease [Synechococcales bacterium]